MLSMQIPEAICETIEPVLVGSAKPPPTPPTPPDSTIIAIADVDRLAGQQIVQHPMLAELKNHVAMLRDLVEVAAGL